MWIELKNLWTTIIPNTPGSYAIAWGTSAVTKPLNISFDPCIWAKMFATFFQLNLIVFTKIWISTWPWPFIIVAVVILLLLLIIIRPFCLRAFWIYRLWDLHQNLSNPVVLNFWKNLEGILPEISPNFGGKNFWPQISTSLTKFHGISSDFPPSIWEGGSLVSTKSLRWLFIEDLFFTQLFVQAYHPPIIFGDVFVVQDRYTTDMPQRCTVHRPLT